MHTCFDIANYFLKCQDEDAGDIMSNMKLQKLVYYAQGFSLAMFGKPLFNEEIMAWEHGPVCPVLWNYYKKYRSGLIPIPRDVNAYDLFSKQEREVLDEVYLYYGQFSAWKLRNFALSDTPWINAYNNDRSVISIDEMKRYFTTLLKEEDAT